MSQIHETIAAQLHHTKPDRLQPGRDVAMSPADDMTLRVVNAERGLFDVTYDEGADLYNVTVYGGLDPDVTHTGLFCDDLGPFIWGNDAKEWTMPLVEITTFDADGNASTERIA